MSAREIRADLSRTCEGCECVRTEPWPVKGSYHEEVTAYRCGAPGPCQGYHIGTVYFFPYVPAWCPKMQEKEADDGTGKQV